MGTTSTEPAHYLEIVQSIAFSNPEEKYNKNLIQLKNTKIKSAAEYCEES